MDKLLWLLKYGIYFFVGVWFLYLTKHNFTILLSIKDLFSCIGIYSMLDFISDEVENRIMLYRIKKGLKQIDEFMNNYEAYTYISRHIHY